VTVEAVKYKLFILHDGFWAAAANAATISIVELRDKYQLFILHDGFWAAAADAATVSIVELRDSALQESFGVNIDEEASMVG
jgi:acyl-coenzyme A thioesterase PaaI-like protein